MENGSVLVPVEMVSPFEFKDGQYVELAYQLLKDRASGCSAGVAAKITKITDITPVTVCNVRIVSTKNSTTPASYTFKTDPINTSSRYYWTFGDNTVSDSHAPTHTYSKAGAYLVKVKVTATDGKICYGELNAQFDGGVAIPPVVTLTGKGKVKKTTSTEGCGLLITMENGSVLVPVEMVSPFEFKDGQYVELAYQLLKDRASGCSAGVAAKITKIADITPVTVCNVRIVSTKNSTTPASYTFKTDPINTSSRYYWTFGDNTVSDSHAPTHTYSKAGAYLVKVKVTATDGKICYGELNAQFDGGVVTPPVVTLTGKGKVTNLSSATGCGLVITTDAGIRLIPATIKTDFVLKEGQNVEFTYEKYAEKVTSCKEGADIKIITIKEIVATTLPSCKGPINLTLYDPTDNKCNGGAKVKLLDENGKEMTNVKYIWSDGRSGSSVESLCPEKLYTVQAIVEHVCQKYTSFTLLSKPIWQTKTTNGQNNFTVLAPVDGVKYEWNFGNGISKTGAAVTYNFQKDGIYDVQLKAVSLNGTSEYTQKVLVLKSIATTDIISKPELEIYPNPVKEVLKIDLKNLPEGDLTAEIRNIAGHSLFIQQINNDGSSYAEINVQSIKAGLYVLRVSNGQHLVSERKFLKAN
jgi:PKD repeat protein